jgi:hypothetical protein
MQMYEGQSIVRWETPVSDTERLVMVSLTDCDKHLDVVLESLADPARRRWRVRFEAYDAYRNTEEMWLGPLWHWLKESGQRRGATFIIQGSSWDGQRAGLPSASPDAQHYLVSTLEDTIEVVSGSDPDWTEVESAAPGEPVPGKIRHWFLPEDRAEVEAMIEETQSRQHPSARE